MMGKIILLIIGLLFIYAIIPTLYNKYFNGKIVKTIKDKSIYLTFDDGPDPLYTNRLLDILSTYNIKATFFLVANKAMKNDDLVYRIVSEGHSIGMHSYDHNHPWLMTPFKTKTNFKNALNILNGFHSPITLYRPPWGLFNAFTYFYAKSYNLKTILWTSSFKDWNEKTPVDYIVNKSIDYIKPGDILLFHDSGGDKYGPKNTLLALDILIPLLIRQGYYFDKL